VFEKDVQVVNALKDRIKGIEYLKEKLLNKEKMKQVVREQIKIIKELPEIFPEDAPIKETLRK